MACCIPNFSRKRFTWVSTVRVFMSGGMSHTSCSSLPRDCTRPDRLASRLSSLNSVAVSGISSSPDEHAVTTEVDAEDAVGEHTLSGWQRHHRLRGNRRVRAPEHGSHAQQELPDRELGLHHVVVGAELESHDPVDLFAPCRQHQDRRAGELGPGPDLAADLGAREVGGA
jgi:hypothetical protein